MENKDKAAFPFATGHNFNTGLTKREYFAALAMQSLCRIAEKYDPDIIAELSIDYADALIKELDKNK